MVFFAGSTTDGFSLFFFPQRILVHREAVAAAERIMDRLVNSIRTPPSSPPRKETIKTVSPSSRPL